MEINDEFLLQCVSNYQPLYDKNHIGYKSCLQKENYWQSVARSLSADVATVKARFKALREKYRREVQIEERLRRSGAPASTRPAWNLMSFFKFMNSRDYSRETISNYANETSTVENNVDYTSETLNDHNYYSEVELQDSHIPTSSAAVVKSPQPKKKKNSYNSSDDIDNVLKDTDAIQGVNENVTKYDQFSLYLATELKSLSANNADLLMDHLMMELLKFKAKVRQS